MSKQIRPDFNQQYLFPPSLEELVPADHPARFIREFVRALDTAALGIAEDDGENGRPHYAADVLLAAWMYGYYSRIRSTRGLERACREHLSLIWLTGNRAPDHNTLWRFFRSNRKALREVFKQSVRVAAGAELVGLVLHALDGTKLQARASRRSGLHREDLDKLVAELDTAIDDMERQIEADQQQSAGEYRLPEELAQAERLREMIRGALDAMAAGVDHASVTDPDARMMQCGGRVEFAYNCQAVADGASGLIVAQEVTNETSDAGQLVPMLDETADTLGAVAQDTAVDGGYESGEQIAAAHDREYGVLLPMKALKEDWEYHASRFEHDAARDVVVCPQGRELEYERTKSSRNGRYTVRVYRCRYGGQCAVRWECSKDKRGRMIEIGEHHEAVRRQLAKQREPGNRCRLKRRGEIVERVFAEIKEGMGLRRFTCGGLDGVRAQWSMICAAFNLRRLYPWWLAGRIKPAGA